MNSISSTKTGQIHLLNNNRPKTTCSVLADLEAEHWPELIQIIEKQIESNLFTRSMRKKADLSILDPRHDLSLEGDELYAKIHCPKEGLSECKMTFPLFDEYSSITKCTCNIDKYILDEKMCEHILTALIILDVHLKNNLPGSEDEKKHWSFLLDTIEKASQADKEDCIEENGKTLRWVLEQDLSITPYIASEISQYQKLEIDQLFSLDPSLDGQFLRLANNSFDKSGSERLCII